MPGVFSDKKYLKTILGIPVVLLLVSVFLNSRSNNEVLIKSGFNPFLKALPSKYEQTLNQFTKNDLTFSSTVFQEGLVRELLIIKKNPLAKQITTDFSVNLVLENNNSLDINVVNNALLFNYKQDTYAVFKTPLPFVDFKKIIVSQKPRFNNQKVWKDTLKQLFVPVKKVSNPKAKQFSVTEIPNIYYSLALDEFKNQDIKTLPSALIVKNEKLLLSRKELNDYISEEKITIGKVVKPNKFWNLINTKNETIKNHIAFLGSDTLKANELLKGYLNGKTTFESTFDIQKLANYNAILKLFTDGCDDELYILYNNQDNLFEPFFVKSSCFGQYSRYIPKPIISKRAYIDAYILALKTISNIDFLGQMEESESFKNEILLINKYYPKNIFDTDFLFVNQKVIKKSLNPSTAIKPEIISVNNNQMVVSILNTASFPVKINELNHLGNKTITSLAPQIEIPIGQRDTVTIELPRSFENLFVSKKIKQTGFVLHKHIYELFIGYNILNESENQYANIIPYQAKENVKKDLFRAEPSILDQEGIAVNKSEKSISFYKDSVTVSSALIIPQGYKFKLRPGAVIDIVEGGKIISHGPLKFSGNKQAPIKIYSSDKKGQGILVLSDGLESNLVHVSFEDLTFPKHGDWSVTGAVTFYESPVRLNNVTIKNNRSEDALNIIRTTFIMNYCHIKNAQSDAFDGDFVEGTISNCTFDILGNDAIDVSGSHLTIKKVVISNAGDKGLSAGEDSKMIINDVDIFDSEIAVAGKDLSIVEIKNLKIRNTKLGFTAFKKKPEFGPSDITVDGIVMENVETKYLIESSSTLFVDGKKIETLQNVKGRMYGVEFGISSDETRNSQ